METISMKMAVPAAPQTGPPGSGTERIQGDSFGKTLATVQGQSGSGGQAESQARLHRDEKPEQPSMHPGDGGGKKKDALQEKEPAGRSGKSRRAHLHAGKKVKPDPGAAHRKKVSAKRGHSMNLPEPKPGVDAAATLPVGNPPAVSPSEMPEAPASMKIPAEGAKSTGKRPVEGLKAAGKQPVEDAKAAGNHPAGVTAKAGSPVPAREVTRSLPEEVKSAVMKDGHQASKTETPSDEAHTKTLQQETLPATAGQPRETGAKDLPVSGARPSAGKDPAHQEKVSPDLIARAAKMPEVPETFNTSLRMPKHAPVRTEAESMLFAGKGKFASSQRRKVPLTKRTDAAGRPHRSGKSVPLNGAKPVQQEDFGASWFREGVVEQPSHHSFSSEGLLSTTGAGKGSEAALPGAGKELAPGLLKQVQSQLHRMVLRGREQITLHLHPDVLGKLKMNLSLQNHHLVAEVTADSSMTREILTSHVHTLKAALLDQGIRLERFDVQLQDHSAEGGYRQAGHAFHQQTRRHPQERGYYRSPPPEEVPVVSGRTDVPAGIPVRNTGRPGINLFA